MATQAAIPPAVSADQRNGSGFYCSTSGTVLTDRESLSEHYKSDFHRYNLKRKVAGLPPVTKEWFEARRAQLLNSQANADQSTVPAGHVRVWFDPLTRRTFRSEQTYQSFVRSNKYLDLVRKSQQPAPEPVISIRRLGDEGAEAPAGPAADSNRAAPKQGQVPSSAGYRVVAPSGGLPLKTEHASEKEQPQQEEDDAEDVSDWETASEDDVVAAQEAEQEENWEEWDVCRSLFDNHISKSFEANLEYMWKKYGFYLPDAQYLTDPEGLLKYLGSKIQYGRVPLYTRGDDANAKQFRSLHAVQRHMVDSGRTKMLYEDNEEEYEEFYDYGDEEEGADEAAGKELAVSNGGGGILATPVSAGYELMVGVPGGSSKVLGSREFARYYRQRHKPQDDRQIVLVNTMLAKYRSLGISLKDDAVSLEQKKLKTKTHTDHHWDAKRRQGLFMRNNVNLNLPKNVPY